MYAITQTTAENWTALEDSTTGRTLGSAVNTTYHYAAGDVSFMNSNAGGSGDAGIVFGGAGNGQGRSRQNSGWNDDWNE